MGLGTLLRLKWSPMELPPSDSYKGQRVLITGGTTGLGFATAQHILRLGAAEVIITCRNAARGRSAQTRLENSVPGSKGRVQVRELDMDTYASCVKFVEGIKRDYQTDGGLDYIVLNAGTNEATYRTSPEGWEADIQVNALSTTLIALLLLPYLKSMRLQRQAPAHLGLVTSGKHLGFDISQWTKVAASEGGILGHYSQPKNFQGGILQYDLSKLLIMYVVEEVVKLALGADGQPEVIVTSICPGMVATDLGRSMRESSAIINVAAPIIYSLVCQSPEVGSRIIVNVGLASKEQHGKFVTRYISDEDYPRRREKNILSKQGREAQALVWKEIREELVAKVPEVRDIVQ